MADVCGYIDLCKTVIETAKTIYDVSKQILTNFQEQKELLMEKVDFLRNRVKLLQKKLEKEGEETGDDMDGLRDVLGNINKLFRHIARFLKEVADYKCSNLFTFIKSFLSEYRDIQRTFKYCTIELHRLKENLNDMILDALFLGMGSFDLQQQLLKAQNDLTKDIKLFKNILAGKDLDDPRIQASLTPTPCDTGARSVVTVPVTKPEIVPLVGEKLQEAESTLDDFEKDLREEFEQELEEYC